MNDKTRPLLVAEIGMNHMGDESYADRYLEVLGHIGLDGVTFQVQTPAYYAEELHRGLALPDGYYRRAAKSVRQVGVPLGVGLCDAGKLALFEEIGISFYKVLSKDIGNRELVAALLATGKPVYAATGLSDEGEVAAFLEYHGTPPNLSLIHTQLSYEDADTNLRAITRLRERFDVSVAFGLHSTDACALYASLGFDPSALFFYVKGSRPIAQRDEAHAIPLAECPAVVAEVKRLATMLGDGVKKKMQNRTKDQRG